MGRINVRTLSQQTPIHEAGATQTLSPTAELDRLVACCMLGERQFYVDDVLIEDRIRELVCALPSAEVQAAALRARNELGLRHVPLLLIDAMWTRTQPDATIIRDTTRAVLRTPRDAMDLITYHWRNGKRPIPHAYARAICDAFVCWSDYQIAKYATLKNVAVRLRDVMFLCRPNPGDRQQLFRALANDELRAPDTWESALSVPGADKRAVWERLLTEHKLGTLALLRNLRNMAEADVDGSLVRAALARADASKVWPWQVLAAARVTVSFSRELADLMMRTTANLPTIQGRTAVLIDVSGSMIDPMSQHSDMRRIDAATGLAVALRDICADADFWVFSHICVRVDVGERRGVELADTLINTIAHSSTMLASAITKVESAAKIDRLIVITDEQTQEIVSLQAQQPTFIINVASTSRGVNIGGNVTRINGWSGNVLRFIAPEIARQDADDSEIDG